MQANVTSSSQRDNIHFESQPKRKTSHLNRSPRRFRRKIKSIDLFKLGPVIQISKEYPNQPRPIPSRFVSYHSHLEGELAGVDCWFGVVSGHTVTFTAFARLEPDASSTAAAFCVSFRRRYLQSAFQRYRLGSGLRGRRNRLLLLLETIYIIKKGGTLVRVGVVCTRWTQEL